MSIQNQSASEIAELTKRYLVPVYKRPEINFVNGCGATLYDDQGRDYIDCCAGIAVNCLGYGNSELESVATTALKKPWHLSNIFNNAPVARLAKLLVESSAFADRVHFSLCGASANEGAFKFARKYAREKYGENKFSILAFSNAFHGRLFGSLAATPRSSYQDSFKPLMPGVRFADFNDLESAKRQMASDICAVIVEPIQGEGGVHAATTEFLQGLRQLCDQHQALLIYDEVQAGLGRSGHLWAWQESQVAPDMLTTAKPLANGLPIGAILLREKISEVMHPGDHASTFAGGPFVTAIAEYVLSQVSAPEFLDRVKDTSNYFIKQLSAAKLRHVKEIRGRGLLLGLELSINSYELAQKALAYGLIVVGAGPNVLRLVPPLVISHAEIDLAVARLAKLLENTE